MNMKKSKSRKVFEVCNIILLTLIALTSLYPLLNQVAVSFSSTSGILNHNVTIVPIDFTLNAYKGILKTGAFWLNYKNTIVYTVVGTAIGLAMTTICSYALSKPSLYGRNMILKFMVFTMFFTAGLVPTYMLIRGLHMMDTIWALVIPGAIAPYHVLLMKTYFEGLPVELEEAAEIDGLSQLGYFFKMALPLSKPIIATMTLFISVWYWNDWFSAVIYLQDTEKNPVTLYLRNLMMGTQLALQSGQTIDATTKTIPQSLQATCMILVIFPVLCIYPFVQKHFTKGVMIGAIKG